MENLHRESLGLCAYCNTRKPLTLDHIEALAKGGAHNLENATLACAQCNQRKHKKTLLVWLAEIAADAHVNTLELRRKYEKVA